MNFDIAFNMLLDHEKGLNLDYNDRGNWTSGRVGIGKLNGTKYGISAMSYPNLDIRNLTIQQTREIYRRDFWGEADKIPESVRFDFFDAAVNSGYSRSVKWLQEAVGVVSDGIIGPKTLHALESMDSQRIAKRFNGFRLFSMTEMGTWSTYGRGWARRIAKNLME